MYLMSVSVKGQMNNLVGMFHLFRTVISRNLEKYFFCCGRALYGEGGHLVKVPLCPEAGLTGGRLSGVTLYTCVL